MIFWIIVKTKLKKSWRNRLYFLGYRKCSFEGEGAMKDGKLGCGGLIAIILLVFAFLNDFASELGGAFQFFFWIGIIIIIAAVVKFFHDN